MNIRRDYLEPLATVEVCRDGATDSDLVVVEAPLQIRVEGEAVAVTMRTPGSDLDLVAGWLYAEGVIDGPDDIAAMAHVDDPADPQGNTVDVVFASGVPAGRRDRARRELFASSACGLCGSAAIERVVRRVPSVSRLEVDPDVLRALPARMREEQVLFQQTGGLHAAALFSASGELEVLAEDIGRHNAVDKVLGWRLRQDRVPVDDRVLLTSGRAGFEIVQKAAVAGVSVLAAVGAPSSLAVETAAAAGMTLVGFLRAGRCTVYRPG